MDELAIADAAGEANLGSLSFLPRFRLEGPLLVKASGACQAAAELAIVLDILFFHAALAEHALLIVSLWTDCLSELEDRIVLSKFHKLASDLDFLYLFNWLGLLLPR